jgi:hypothetical protein
VGWSVFVSFRGFLNGSKGFWEVGSMYWHVYMCGLQSLWSGMALSFAICMCVGTTCFD